MTVFVCLDDKMGMTFGGRRQSRDSKVIEDIFATVGKENLFIAPFSEKLLDGRKNVKVKRDPLGAAKRDFCFIEDRGIEKHINDIDTLIIYKWNRHYPSDMKFDVIPADCGFVLTEAVELAGTSHEKITKEIYKR